MNIKTAAFVARTIVVNFFRPSFARMMAGAVFQWKWQCTPRNLRAVALGSLGNHPAEVRLFLCPQTHGEPPPDDLIALCSLVRMRRPTTLFEFGTFRGQGTINMAMNAAPGAVIHTLDAPPEKRAILEEWDSTIDVTLIGQHFRSSPYERQITQVLEDSRTFDPAPYAGSMELVFIDAGHDYDCVANDSRKAFEMLASDGMVIWHDYSPVKPGVRSYLEELALKREVFWLEHTQIAFCIGRNAETSGAINDYNGVCERNQEEDEARPENLGMRRYPVAFVAG